MGPRRDRARPAVRGHRARRHGELPERTRAPAHADAHRVPRLLEEGPAAGLGHRSGVIGTSTAPRVDATFHAVQRRLAGILPDGAQGVSDAPLEHLTLGTIDPPRLISASVLEGKVLEAHPVEGEPVARFVAFLDGTQTSRVVAHAD